MNEEKKQVVRIEETPQFKDIELHLQNFEQEIKLQKLKIEEPRCMTINIEEMRRKTPEELNEIILEGMRYSLAIQMNINRKEALKKWAKSKLDDAQAYYIQNISTNYGFNERPLIARHDPPLCKQLNEFIRRLQVTIDLAYDVPNQIKYICDIIRDQRFLNAKREKQND